MSSPSLCSGTISEMASLAKPFTAPPAIGVSHTTVGRLQLVGGSTKGGFFVLGANGGDGGGGAKSAPTSPGLTSPKFTAYARQHGSAPKHPPKMVASWQGPPNI